MKVVELAQQTNTRLRDIEKHLAESKLMLELHMKELARMQEEIRELIDVVDPINSRVYERASTLGKFNS